MFRLGLMGCLGRPDRFDCFHFGVWLCAVAVYQSQFEMWNDDHPILVKWIHSKSPRNQVVVAGSANKLNTRSHLQWLTRLRWHLRILGPFNNQTKKPVQLAVAGPSGSIPAAAARKLEAPIEEKFKQQAAEREEFKEQQQSSLLKLQSNAGIEVQQLQQDVKKLREVVAKQCRSFEHQNELNTKESGAIRQESKEQIAQFAASLQDILKQSLAKQDHVMASQFQELKNFLPNKDNPPKK